jgi:hypothetical protein
MIGGWAIIGTDVDEGPRGSRGVRVLVGAAGVLFEALTKELPDKNRMTQKPTKRERRIIPFALERENLLINSQTSRLL